MRQRHHRVDLVHGTTSGYETFKCRCKDCRAAKAAYMTDLRVRRNYQWERLYSKAVTRAATRLKDAHREEFDRYLTEEKMILREAHLSRPA